MSKPTPEEKLRELRLQERLIRKRRRRKLRREASHRPPPISVRLPSSFSFIENAEGVNRALAKISTIAQAGGPGKARLSILTGKVRTMGQGAATALSGLLREHSKTTRVTVYGRPRNERVAAAMDVSRLSEYLWKEHDYKVPGMSLRLEYGQAARDDTRESTRKEIVADRIATFFSKCVRDLGYTLSRKSIGTLAIMAGEALENAERHSLQRKWWATADLSRRPDGTNECRLVFFNRGRSIESSMQSLPPDAEIRDQIRRVLLAQRAHPARVPVTDGCIWTLAALQQGVSSKATEEELGQNPGLGLAKLIRFFQILSLGHVQGTPKLLTGGEKPRTQKGRKNMRMTVVSGDVQILFDGRYYLTSRKVLGGQRDVIAFNPTNDLRQPPDPKCVVPLSSPLQGTVISMRFDLFPDHLERLRPSAVVGSGSRAESSTSSLFSRIRDRISGLWC